MTAWRHQKQSRGGDIGESLDMAVGGVTCGWKGGSVAESTRRVGLAYGLSYRGGSENGAGREAAFVTYRKRPARPLGKAISIEINAALSAHRVAGALMAMPAGI